MVKIISIGLIPSDSKSEIIQCGDSETSNTIELNFKIENQNILGLDNNFSFSFVGVFLTPNSNHLKELSKYISKFGLKISYNTIYNGFSLLDDLKDTFSQKFKIIESGGGVFENTNLKYNGKFYLRKYLDNNGKIVHENVCIKLID
ncbi:MAG: hypothetical protein CMC48_08695 [Flavobacteriaceae bacterium]|nr:hypothetical protein [Flavobacteriaceae bacterium]|tara:strand:- start:178 stop:615 length:438 start_codon:yes stop_codon:yes gene_type:complete